MTWDIKVFLKKLPEQAEVAKWMAQHGMTKQWESDPSGPSHLAPRLLEYWHGEGPPGICVHYGVYSVDPEIPHRALADLEVAWGNLNDVTAQVTKELAQLLAADWGGGEVHDPQTGETL